MHIPTQTQLSLLLRAVDEMIGERSGSPDPRVRQEAEILQLFRAQLCDQMRSAA